MNRRHFSSLVLTALVAGAARAAETEEARFRRSLAKRLAEIERAGQGTLGVQIHDTANGARYGYREDERFLMCSTFKMLASALVLHRVDQGRDSLDRRVAYRRADLLSYAPVTEKHVDEGMTMGALCEAAITYSDNTAANLILASYGGPKAVTAFARSLGDKITRLDRNEPALNTRHGLFDTTTPHAMQQTLERVALGDGLAPASREQLQRWLLANTTGSKKLRAGLPTDWKVGDKTGAGGRQGLATSNDIAVVWPPGRAPLVVAAFLTQSKASADERDATLARVGELLVSIVQQNPTH